MIQIPVYGGHFAKIDDQFLPLVSEYKWYLYRTSHRVSYAQGYHPKTKERVMMHRLIMNAPKKMLVDHKDKDGLNNVLSNLRIATSGENLCNRSSVVNSSSKFLGVTFHKKANKWVVHICKNRKMEYLGLFADEKDAALAYNERAKVLHGEFASLNIL